MTNNFNLKDHIRKNWQMPFLQYDGLTFTFGQIYCMAKQFNARLGKDYTLVDGERVVSQLKNRLYQAVVHVASIQSDYILIPIDPELTNTDTQEILEITSPSLVLNDSLIDSWINTNVQARLPEILQIRAQDAPWVIFFSSGTSGVPKGVVHTLKTIYENAAQFEKTLKYNDRKTYLNMFSLAYMAGFLNCFMIPFLNGDKVVLIEKFSSSTPLNLWRQVIDGGVTHMWLSPTMLEISLKFLRDPTLIEEMSHSLKCVFTATAPLSKSLHETAEDRYKLKIVTSYGSTETLINSLNLENKKSRVGKPLTGITIYADEESQLVVKTASQFVGYWDGQKKCIQNYIGDYISGDIFDCDEDGNIAITGRLTDIINRGGEKISPINVEEVIKKHSSVSEVAVCGAVDEVLGEKVVAYIVKKGSEQEDDLRGSLIAHCEGELKSSHIPRDFYFVNMLPKTDSGKIKRHSLSMLRAVS